MTTERTVLVTGGAGFIGSHTCKALARVGFLPVSYDNLVTGNRDAVKWGPLIEGDIRDRSRLVEALLMHRPAAVIHFAASAYVGESVEDPGKYYSNNVVGTLTLLDACRAAGMSNIVFSSSCATYGIPDVLPISEVSPQRPINPYGRTKLIGEQMICDHAAAYGLRYGILRYFNAAGADPDGELGERHDPETHLIPLAIRATSAAGEPLRIFGTNYPTPDGTCIRDYIHVTDLASAHVLALAHLQSRGENLVVNIGTGKGISVHEIVAAVETISGRRVKRTVAPQRPGDPPVLVAQCEKAQRVLGFEPRFSDVETIVRTAQNFFDRAALTTQPTASFRPQEVVNG